jgi:hypothetical protein
MTDIVFAILAKDKAYCLPLYLECLYNQTYPKKLIHLYIRTNDNNDETEHILHDFIIKHENEYASVFFDSSDISHTLKNYAHHEWNIERFHILGEIRQQSINYAIKMNSHYFVADCDNFITPNTLSSMYNHKDFGVISPMLVSSTAYSNYHFCIDNNGYYADSPLYMDILMKRVKGIISVPVVHCTYFINNKYLKVIGYSDNSNRYEYVIFSDILRINNIEQYLDNTNFYGFLVICENNNEYQIEIEKWSETIQNKFKLSS